MFGKKWCHAQCEVLIDGTQEPSRGVATIEATKAATSAKKLLYSCNSKLAWIAHEINQTFYYNVIISLTSVDLEDP